MQSNAAEKLKFNAVSEAPPSPSVTGTELEQWVGVGLLNDLNQQLADISSRMERQIKDKQSLRNEIDAIYRLKQSGGAVEINGQKYRDLSPTEAELLGVTQEAVPQTDETGRVLGYRLGEELFQTAAEQAVRLREEDLASLNDEGEWVMLKIQSLIDQRKNALTLLSNLLAASNDVAKTIIANIRS